MEDAYARSVTEVLEAFGVDPAKGLTDSQVSEHARIYGRNVLPQEPCGEWKAKQHSGDLEGSAASTPDLQRQLVTVALRSEGSGPVSSSFSYVSPSSADFSDSRARSQEIAERRREGCANETEP
jgi:hypothetical protein